LCLVFLAVLGVAVARWLDPLATVNLLLLCSFGILLVRGAYFQPEPLYYMFFLCAGVMACRLLRGGTWRHYAVLGVAGALAFLAKPSVLPFVLTFAVAFAVRVVLTLVRRSGDWPLAKNLGGVALAAGIFAVMIFPLGRYSAEVYGRPFFSYTKYWMWMDDFKTEAFPFSASHADRESLAKLTPEETPSLAWYLKRHSAQDAVKREAGCTGEVIWRFFFPEPKQAWRGFFWRMGQKKWQQPLTHRGVYVIGLAALCAGLAWPLRKVVLARVGETGNLVCVGFVLVTVAFYTALYGWYYPIGHGDRFMGSLWMPAVFLLCWLAFSLRRLSARKVADAAYLVVHALVLVMLLVQVANVFWRFSIGWYLETRN